VRLELLHRRLVVGMGLVALVAFAGGAGFEPASAILAGIALTLAFAWQPDHDLSLRLEQFWLPLAALLVIRSLYHVFLVGDDVVIPVVDLLLLLLSVEALRSLDAPNDARLYALTFALLLASTAYRPGVLFALAFVVYITLATVALMVGHLCRKASTRGGREIVLDRKFLVGMAGLSGVTLMMSGIVFVAFPRFSRGWASRGEVLATSIAGFTDEVSIGSHGSRIFPNPEIVLQVEFPDGRPTNMGGLHWRGRSYDRFDGVRWSRSPSLPPSLGMERWYESWTPDRVRQRIYAAPLDVRILFALHPLLGVRSDNPRIQPLFDNAGDHVYWGSGNPSYEAVSVAGRPQPESLRAARTGFAPARNHFTQLPRLSQRTGDLARSLTQGLDNNYDRAVAIEGFFHNEFGYTLDLPRSAREATLEYFLFDRREGHCEYFSTAMVVLLRTMGIHAREVNGFLGGQWNEFGQYLAVTQNEAHSWVEVWFPGYGWVPFDPTPAGAGTSEALTSWLWPGRFLLDGLQHRWNKWILDYDQEAQSGLIRRTSELFRRDGPTNQAADRPSSRDPVAVFWGILMVLALGLSVYWTNRGPSGGPETRLYLRLRESCRRAGLVPNDGIAPLALVDELARRRHPAYRPAQSLVTTYLQSRFGGQTLDASAQEEMKVALAAVRRALRSESGLTPPSTPS
jgi:transglutaminase-like putative cysteine protease/uncharacterized metal-binding protein